jgi:hypothetical protein
MSPTTYTVKPSGPGGYLTGARPCGVVKFKGRMTDLDFSTFCACAEIRWRASVSSPIAMRGAAS